MPPRRPNQAPKGKPPAAVKRAGGAKRPASAPAPAGPRIMIPPRAAYEAHRGRTAAAIDRWATRVADLAPRAGIRVDAAPASQGKTRWGRVITIKIGAEYAQAHDALAGIPADLLGARRLARVRMGYTGPKVRPTIGAPPAVDRDRVSREVTIAEITPLDVAIARALRELDPAGDGMGSRYYTSRVRRLEVWISDDYANDTGEF